MGTVEFIKDNWAVISTAPWTFISLVVLFGGGGILFGRFWHAGVISNLESRLALRDDQIADYKVKLDGASPDEAAKKIEALEHRLAALEPRRLSQEQRQMLVTALSANKGFVMVWNDITIGGTGELANDLSEAFRDAGWSVRKDLGIGHGKKTATGLLIQTDKRYKENDDGGKILTAFNTAKIEYDYSADWESGLPVNEGYPTVSVSVVGKDG